MSMGIEIQIIEKIAKKNIPRTRGYLVSTRSLVRDEIYNLQHKNGFIQNHGTAHISPYLFDM